MTQNLLSKYFEIHTKKPKMDIFSAVIKKIELQEKEMSVFSTQIVDYKSFKIDNNWIIVERWPSFTNPFRGLGTIYFNFEIKDDETLIKCNCKPFVFPALILIVFVIMFLIIMTLIFFNAKENNLQLTLFFLFIWTIGIGSPVLGFLYHQNALKEYANTILNDLGIKPSCG